MNVNEHGIVFQLGVGFNISGFTTLSLTFTKPSGALLTVTNSTSPAVSAPAIAGEEALANEYFQYTFADGNVDEDGEWSVRGTYTDSSKKLISDAATFTVDP